MLRHEVAAGLLRVLIAVVDPSKVQRRRSTPYPVNFAAFLDKKLGEVRPILDGDTCVESLSPPKTLDRSQALPSFEEARSDLPQQIEELLCRFTRRASRCS